MWNILFGLSVWALRNGPALMWALLCLQPPKYREKHAYNYHINMVSFPKGETTWRSLSQKMTTACEKIWFLLEPAELNI